MFDFLGTCEAYSEFAGARAELRLFDWRDKMHEGSFSIAQRFVELTDVRATGGYQPGERHWRNLGAIRFYPGNRRFYSRWVGDRQTSLLCALDMEHLTGRELEVDDDTLINCCDVRNDYLRTLLLRVQRELEAPGFVSDMVVETACMAAAAELVQHFSRTDRGRNPGRGKMLSEGAVLRIAEQIRDGGTIPSLEALARSEGLSKRHFARLFRATTGESVGRFCAQHLIRRSIGLLSNKRLLIKEVAYQCGFANTASFSRAFQRETGYSPLELRKRQPASSDAGK